MKKKIVLALILGGLSAPTTNCTSFNHKNKPFGDKALLTAGGIISLAGYWCWLKATKTTLHRTDYRSWFYGDSQVSYELKNKGPIMIRCSQVVMGLGAFLALPALIIHYRLKAWNERTDDQVYKDAQGTYNQLVYNLREVYRITGNDLDTMLPLKNSHKIIKHLQTINGWQDYPLIAIVETISYEHSLLVDHFQALKERMKSLKLKDTTNPLLLEGDHLLTLMSNEEKILLAIQTFIKESPAYKKEIKKQMKRFN